MKPVIYQIFTRLYGNSNKKNFVNGTLEQNGCAKMKNISKVQLDRLYDFGFTHVWYTGLLEHATQTDYSQYGIAKDHHAVVKGVAGSPYAVKDYYDIDPDLAVDVKHRMHEFENLVKRTHRSKLKFIMDFVPNHVARQYKSDACLEGVSDLGQDDDVTKAFDPQNNFYYVLGDKLHAPLQSNEGNEYEEFPAKVTGNDHFDAWPSINDWYETVKLNYGVDYLGGHVCHFDPIPSTWMKMTNILLFWASKGVDAFRCDMAEMVPVEFWQYAISSVREKYPEVQFIAEVYNPSLYRAYISAGFDFLYDKVGLYDTLRAVMCNGLSASNITGCWQSIDDIRDHMLNFLENHDEQRIASDFFAHDAKKARPALVVSAMMGKNPFMVYAGQELGEKGMDAEGFSGCDGRTTIFDYWSVDSLRKLTSKKLVNEMTDEEKDLYFYYKRVLKMCRDEAAFAEGTFYDLQYANMNGESYDPSRQYSFIRQAPDGKAYLVMANFSDSEANVGVVIPTEAFKYHKMSVRMCVSLDALSGKLFNFKLQPNSPIHVTIPSNGALILPLQ